MPYEPSKVGESRLIKCEFLGKFLNIFLPILQGMLFSTKPKISENFEDKIYSQFFSKIIILPKEIWLNLNVPTAFSLRISNY